MDINPDNSRLPGREGISITEAALRLGVSERTIYRMLREGKLHRIVSDKNRRSVRLYGEWVDVDASHRAVAGEVVSDKLSDNLPGIVPDELLKALRQELREKDAQIERLIEQQREMTAALNRLQDQMFELARLTLSQNVVTVSSAQGPSLPTKEVPGRRTWWQWWKRRASS